jgi:hypothetical protein
MLHELERERHECNPSTENDHYDEERDSQGGEVELFRSKDVDSGEWIVNTPAPSNYSLVIIGEVGGINIYRSNIGCDVASIINYRCFFTSVAHPSIPSPLLPS